MKRWLKVVAVFGLLATACQFQPLEDPGLGDRGLTSVVYASIFAAVMASLPAARPASMSRRSLKGIG